MTREEVMAMVRGREMDALVHQVVLGKEIVKRAELTKWPGRYVYEPQRDWDSPEYLEWLKGQDHGEWEVYGVRNYSSDLYASFEVEEKIAQMDGALLVGYYMTNLILIVGDNGFKMIHATPEQRCKAALLAVMEC